MLKGRGKMNLNDSKTELKKHTCPTCGGQLQINLDKQMYVCPYCGVSFDYSYFREEDVMMRAELFRASAYWNAAIDAYDFMLVKDPHNFWALRGKVLATAYMRRGFVMKESGIVRPNYVLQSIRHALSATDEEHRVYFEKMQEYIEGVEKYNEEKKKLDKMREKYNDKRHLLATIENPLPSFDDKMQIAIVKAYGYVGLLEIVSIIGYFGTKRQMADIESGKTYSYRYRTTENRLKELDRLSGSMHSLKICAIVLAAILVGATAFFLISSVLEKRRIKKAAAKVQQELDAIQKDITPFHQALEELKEHNRQLKLEIHKMDTRYENG